MCKMIFIGVSEKVQEIPWNEEKPAFFLKEPTSEENDILPNFTKPYIYFVGTRRGCSCDFITYSNIYEDEYEDERLALEQVILSQTSKGESVEVYCCWAGDYATPLDEKSYTVYNNSLKDFYIDEREMIVYQAK